MTLSNNKTKELWQSFMPRRKEIQNNIGTELNSIQVYDGLYFKKIESNLEFEKWATIEGADFKSTP